MSVIGVELDSETLVLTKNRDFRWTFQNLDANGSPVDFPAGSLFFEIYVGETVINWPFSVSGANATIKIESAVANTIPNRSKWQLVFLPTGEAAGGDPIARGTVRVQE